MTICDGDVLQYEKILISPISVFIAKLSNHVDRNKVKETKEKPIIPLKRKK